MERTIETIAYCLQKQLFMVFCPLKIFLAERQKSCVKITCWGTHAMDSMIKSGQKDTEANI